VGYLAYSALALYGKSLKQILVTPVLS
jgi:hypothetical protein